MIKEITKYVATEFIMSRHYSPVMPKLTKHYCGYYVDDVLQGVVTFGWGTRPKHTIQKLFPTLDTTDYYEIGKMCMDDSMGKNSETQMLSKVLTWLKQNTTIKFLFTWADGLVGKPGYVYQAFNFLYGGFIWTDTYVTDKGEKVHPRTIQSQLPNTHNYKYGSRPNPKQLKQLRLSRVKGKQFRYILPMNKKMRKFLKQSTVDWNLNYPKDKDLVWKIKRPGDSSYTLTNIMPFKLTKEVEYNKDNVERNTGATLESFFE
tara:strand:- start:947 stop:1726 length:780 start_codon:yes stop_codon:yes gene_type:complete